MNHKVASYLSARRKARLRAALNGRPTPTAAFDLVRLGACVQMLCRDLPEIRRRRVLDVLAYEFEELLTRFCLDLNSCKRRKVERRAGRRGGLVAEVEAAWETAAEVLDLFETATGPNSRE